MGQLLPQCIHAWKTLPSPGQGRAGGKHKCSWSGSSLGTQAQPSLGDTDSTQREMSTPHFKRAQNSPPLLPPVFGTVRGTPQTRDIDAAQPKTKENPRKKQAASPARENIQLWEGAQSVLGLPCFHSPEGSGIPWGLHWDIALGRLQGVQNCHCPHPGLHPRQLPAPSSVTHAEPGEEPGAAQVGWGGSTPGGQNPSER